ncbi:MAG TPA: PAS domain S-box protein [Bryobacteraceae bacterium]|nr:PAS domain S-box protein [Bryobacteraceae bacterium]
MISPSFLGDQESADLTSMFEFCPEMLAILSDDGMFRRASVASVDTIGHSSAELVGKSFYDLIHPEDKALAVKQFEQAVQGSARVTFRGRCRASDDQYRWIQWSLCRPRNMEQVYAVARDVTDHSTAEKDLARANDILSTVLLSAPLPIWASDTQGRLQFWNQAAEKILGWTSEEVLQGVPPELLPRCSEGEQTVRLSGEKRTWRRKDGSSREFRFWTSPLRENGSACGTFGMAVDVTEYDSEVYEALQQAYDDLRNTREAVMQHERLRVIGQMASGIAHDINNALAPVKLYTQVLLEDENGLSERGRGNLNTIRKAIDDVTETVARLREFYRSRQAQLTLVPLNLNELISQVLDLTRARWRDMPQQSGITIKVATQLADGLPLALGVEAEIREALINLIFNAVDAMPTGGTLTLLTGVTQQDNPFKSNAEEGRPYIEVTDSGIGMDENTLRRCMEPFFTTKGERGTGLGLAMVYGILKRNNATIEIESTPGRGTTMRLIFGIARKPEGGPDTEVKLDALSGLRVLVVDDDPLVAEVLRDILERDGHSPMVAESGEDGIQAFRDAQARGQAFDIVLTDLGMPHMDGRRVAHAIKAVSSSTPVSLLTGWGRRLISDGDIPPGVDQVLSKPPDLTDLRHAMACCLAPRVA